MNEHSSIQDSRTDIQLARHFQVFVDDQVAAGYFGSATQVVEEALRLLERRESKLKALRQALIDGEESGEPTPFDMEEIIRSEREAAGVPDDDA